MRASNELMRAIIDFSLAHDNNYYGFNAILKGFGSMYLWGNNLRVVERRI
jgi:hypothetical protein